MLRRRGFRRLAPASLAGAAACAPEPASVQGERVKELYDLFLVVAAIVFVIVAGLIAWSIVRYRDRGDTEQPEQFRHSRRIEIVWFAIPQILVIALFVASTNVHTDVNDTAEEPGVTVAVRAFQWGWRFTYEGRGVDVVGTPQAPAEIALPTDTDVAFVLSSRDVIHSFFVPRFLVKRDAIPGHSERIDVHIDRPGTYEGECAEFCGLLHDAMGFTIRAVPPAEFDAWLQAQAAL